MNRMTGEKSKKYRAALFDMDGTILNTLEGLKDAVNHTMSAMNCPLRTLEEVRRFVGNGIKKLLERSLPEERRSEEELAYAYALFCDFYGEHCAERTAPYEGIPELLVGLKERGVRLASVTNKADFAAKLLCEKFYPGIFDFVLGAREELPRKPAPDGVFLALKALGVQADEAVFVGDSDVDYHTAKNAGLDCALVSWGFRDGESLRALPGAVVCDTAAELKKFLEKE